jgi:phosphate:Na+ symporter
MAALDKECRHLYDNAFEILALGLRLDPQSLRSDRPIKSILQETHGKKPVDIDTLYNLRLKSLYGEIVDFATRAQAQMPSEYGNRLFRIKIACRHLIETVKAVKHLQKNLDRYLDDENPHIRKEYRKMVKRIAKLLRRLDTMARSGEKAEIDALLQKGLRLLEKNDILANGSLDRLIRDRLISNEMATSLMNDNLYVSTIISGMLAAAEILFGEEEKSESPHPEAEMEGERGSEEKSDPDSEAAAGSGSGNVKSREAPIPENDIPTESSPSDRDSRS